MAGGEHLAFVAHHLTEAARYGVLLAPHDPATHELVDRAAQAGVDAAVDARLREDSRGAKALLYRALALPATRAVRMNALLLLQQVLLTGYQYGPHQ